jgi:hypothetical protein
VLLWPQSYQFDTKRLIRSQIKRTVELGRICWFVSVSRSDRVVGEIDMLSDTHAARQPSLRNTIGTPEASGQGFMPGNDAIESILQSAKINRASRQARAAML